jgi:glycine betaine catabolism A
MDDLIISNLTGLEKAAANKFPSLSKTPVPVDYYTSPAIFEQEREKIFKRHWLLVGRTESLPRPGDYFVHELEIARTSILIVKSKDNKVRAFHNVCRHRANKVASGHGNSRYFTCSNHGWSYNDRGELVVVPDESQFHDLDKRALGLRAVHCEVWNGLVFINLDSAPQETLLNQLDGFATQFADFPFESFRCGGTWSSVLRCNWKVFQDMFQEAYHVSTVHAGTFPTLYNGRLNPGGRPGAFEIWGRNRNVAVVVDPDYQPTPVEKISGELGTTWTSSARRTYPGTNWSRNRYYNFDLNGVFPNLLLNPGNGFFFNHHFWPISVNQTRWVGNLYLHPAEKASEILSQAQAYILIRDAWREDLALGEELQRGLESGAIDSVHFSDSEIACRHAYEVNSQILRA